MKNKFADIIIPLSVSGIYTYHIPAPLADKVRRGSRVIVPFGPKKVYTGLVSVIHNNAPDAFTPRDIADVFQSSYNINDRLLDFLFWLSDYYLAMQGEVVKAAFPSPMLPEGEKQIKASVKAEEKRQGLVKKRDKDNELQVVTLSSYQSEAFKGIKSSFDDHEVVLLHGVTSSGKTEIYIHLILDQIARGKQVLYMLPEIALTTQIIERLRKHFGNSIGIYHSRLTVKARIEVWKRVASGDLNIILGVRSSLFLPFSDLGLVIVDEEHDTSYKQSDPSPRYHARDAAMMLSRIHGARTVLGSATPSVESYYNALTGKYGLVELTKRYGDVVMPSMMIADIRSGGRKKSLATYFSQKLVSAVEEALQNGEQVMLFQNRRGFSPFIMCIDCGWVPGCTNCSVSYTYHKTIDRLICHYCGKSERLPSICPECGSASLITKGFGTEKVEEEIKLLFPAAKVARMDQDTTGKRDSHSAILSDFASGSTNILIGTQMISKGLDFESLTVVGILDADSSLHFPDFRAYERSFQMMEQVSGRAGRRAHQGKVIIQTANPAHIVLRQVIRHDYKSMYQSQLEERELFSYPPFTRLVRITVKHRDNERLNLISERLAGRLREKLGRCVLGPEYPLIMQVQKWYIKTIVIKIGKNISAARAKEIIRKSIETELKVPGQGRLRINADVDPQ